MKGMAYNGWKQDLPDKFWPVIFDNFIEDPDKLRELGLSMLESDKVRDEEGQWPYQLRDYLNERGIDAQVIEPKSPITEVVCDYVGVVGVASSSLRECRASCNNTFVVGLVSLSNDLFLSPEFAYGKSTGIGWINDDGGFNPDIFNPCQCHH